MRLKRVSSSSDNPENVPPVAPAAIDDFRTVAPAAHASKNPKRRFERVDESEETLNIDAEESMANSTTDIRSVSSVSARKRSSLFTLTLTPFARNYY